VGLSTYEYLYNYSLYVNYSSLLNMGLGCYKLSPLNP